jgi:hypothetical protein
MFSMFCKNFVGKPLKAYLHEKSNLADVFSMEGLLLLVSLLQKYKLITITGVKMLLLDHLQSAIEY